MANMPAHTLTRQRRPRPGSTALTEQISLVHGRVHELCGPARKSLALRIAAHVSGPILWLRPSWDGSQINADGIAPHINPARIVFASAKRAEDILWCAEEALRSGAAPLVVAELAEPPALTPIRRLHLAAETTGTPPLIVLLTPEDGGAQGVETRWHVAPRHGPAATSWSLTRLRARMAPPAHFSYSE